METVLGMTDLQIKLFTAFGQLSVAGIVGYIAWQQWRTAQKKLKADLFDRRFAAYREMINLTNKVMFGDSDNGHDAAVTGTNAADQLERVAQEMVWLFDGHVAVYVKEQIADRAMSFVFAAIDLAASSDEEQSEELTVELSVIHRDLRNNLQRATNMLGQYLKLEH